jgi:polyisoprenoid-binding protein YceI
VSRFVVTPEESQLSAIARSSLHAFSYRAPLTGEIEATVRDGQFDLASAISGKLEVDLDSLRGDDPHTDGEMQRRLDTQRFPRARAAVQHVTTNGGDAYRLSGELTLRGQTRPLEGDATVTLAGDQLHATGSLTIDLREFGIKPPSLLILRVHPEIDITIDLVAVVDHGG